MPTTRERTHDRDQRAGDTKPYDDEFDIVANQQAQSSCGCGDPVVLYEGQWYHVYNPALTGTDDHDANPDGEIIPNPHYDPSRDLDEVNPSSAPVAAGR